MPEEDAKPTVATIAISGTKFTKLDAPSAPCAEEVVPTIDAANAPARTSFFIMDLHLNLLTSFESRTALIGHDPFYCYKK